MMDIEQIAAQAVDTDSIVVSARQSLATARAFQLSAYDAVYLDLARRERLPLATLDDRLRNAAGRAGVELLR
jgi:predicted nucleic acid-binding protein